MHSKRQPSTLRAARGTVPATQSAIEFELMVLHNSAYPKTSRLDIPFLRRFLETHKAGDWPVTMAHNIGTTKAGRCVPESAGPGKGAGHASATIGPRLPPTFCHDRLHQLHISYWSTTPVTNEYAATLLSSYFERDHAICGTFDANLFLGDLIDRRLTFCSPFLVCSVLYMACVGITSTFTHYIVADY